MPLKKLGGFGIAPLQEMITQQPQNTPQLVTLGITVNQDPTGLMPSVVHPTNLLVELDPVEVAYDGTFGGAVAENLSAQTKITVSLWLFQNAFSNGNGIGLEFGASTVVAGGFGVAPNNSTSSAFAFGMGAGSGWWYDSFTRPSAAAWHHYLFIMDRTALTNVAYLDGVLQTLATVNHTGSAYGSYGNQTLNMMMRQGGSLFNTGKLRKIGIWAGSETLTQTEINELAGIAIGEASTSSVIRLPATTIAASDGDVSTVISSKVKSQELDATSGPEVTSLLRVPTRILSVSRPSSSSLLRAPQRLLTSAVTSIASLIRSPSRSITSTGTDTTSLKRQPNKILTATGGDSSTLLRAPGRVLASTITTATSLLRSAATTILAIYRPDGVISGGIGSAFTGLQVQASIQRARLNGGVGGMVINNNLLVSAGHPTLDRIDTVWVFGPAGYTGAFSAPNPPGYDVEHIEGVPAVSPVPSGFSSGFFSGNPYVSVGFDSPYYFASLFSYRVPAGATASSQFTNFTDLRTLVPDGNGFGGISLSTLIRQPGRILSTVAISVATLLRSVARTLTTTAIGVSTLAFAVAIVLSVVVTTVATLTATVVTGGIVLTCAGAAVVKLIKQPNKKFSSSGGDSSALVHTPQLQLPTSGVSSSTISRAVSKTLTVVAHPVAALQKLVARVLFVSETSIPVVLPVRVKRATLASTGGDSSTLQRIPKRTLVAHGISQSSIVRVAVHTLRYLSVSNTFLRKSGSTTLVIENIPEGDSSIQITVTKLLTSTGSSLASIASHVFPFVAHLFAILRVYKQWQFDGYQVYEVNLARQRFDIVASKVYEIRRVFKRWQ